MYLERCTAHLMAWTSPVRSADMERFSSSATSKDVCHVCIAIGIDLATSVFQVTASMRPAKPFCVDVWDAVSC